MGGGPRYLRETSSEGALGGQTSRLLNLDNAWEGKKKLSKKKNGGDWQDRALRVCARGLKDLAGQV